MILDGGHSLQEYLRLVVPGRHMLGAVFSSRLYQLFVQAAPGLRELMMLGKVYYECERASDGKNGHLIIVDAPASGHALNLLRMPGAARATFGSSIVGGEADNIQKLIRDPRRCAIVEVTTADALALSELLETHDSLRDLHLHPAVILLNRFVAVEFDSSDVTQLVQQARTTGAFKEIPHLADIARGELARSGRSREVAARIRHHTRAQVVEVPELTESHGRELVQALASFFAARLNGHSVRHVAAKG